MNKFTNKPRRNRSFFSLRRRSGVRGPLALEQLEPKWNLNGTGFEGNACPPDLNLSAVATQSIRAGNELVVNLLTAGGTVVDLDGDGNPTGDTIRFSLDPDDNPAGATITSAGVFHWTPTGDQVGVFEIVVFAVDSGSPPLADAETFIVEVEANLPPDLQSISDTVVPVHGMMEVSVSATEPDGDTLVFLLDYDDPGANVPDDAVIVQTSNHTAVIRWTPGAEDAGGSFDFSVLVVDDGFPPLTDRETFTVDVMTVVATPDEYNVDVDGTLEVDAAGVLANDSDVTDDALTATVASTPDHGSLTLLSDGSFTYTPSSGFQGTDTFTYRAEDASGDYSETTVTIIVNTAPTATADEYSVDEDMTLNVLAPGVLSNDSDNDTLTATLFSDVSHGALTLNSDGSFAYVPDLDFHGTDEFSYTASDGVAQTAETLVTITVNSVNDSPVAVADAYTTDEDTTLSVIADNGVLDNDSDVDSGSIMAILVQDVAHGDLTLNSDGSFTYVPDDNFHGTDTFTYVADDGDDSSAETTVTITVNSINDEPVAVSDEYSAPGDAALVVNAASGVLANDSDVDGDALMVTMVADVDHGDLTLNSDGSFTYTPVNGFVGTDTFTYTASDGVESTGETTVTITVLDPNTFSIPENSVAGSLVGQVSTSSNLGSNVVYSFEDSSLDALLELASDDHISGNPDGPVVLIEYLDFECPVCLSYHPIVDQIVADFGDDLMLVTRHIPLIIPHENAFAAAVAAEAAGRQGAFDAFGDLLFANQSVWNDTQTSNPQPFFEAYANQLGLNLTQFIADLSDPDLAARVQRDLDAAVALGSTGAPTFFLNGVKLTNPASLANFETLIQTEINADNSVFTIDSLTGRISVRDSAALDFETTPSFTLTVHAVGSDSSQVITVTVNLTDQVESAPLTSLDDAFAGDDWTDLLE